MTSKLSPRRRQLLHGLAQTALVAQLPHALVASAQTPNLLPTPACGAPAKATAEQTEGPYFKRSSPLRQSLLDDSGGGERLRLTGRVLNTRCQPIAQALLDFWQADGAGAYDNRGFRMRGHQFSNATGIYQLETVLPGLYPGRTRHIHVKVQAPGGRVLTTQLYFPDEAANRGDGIFSAALVVLMRRDTSGALAGFDFVLG